jgi:hypothetical protein
MGHPPEIISRGIVLRGTLSSRIEPIRDHRRIVPAIRKEGEHDNACNSISEGSRRWNDRFGASFCCLPRSDDVFDDQRERRGNDRLPVVPRSAFRVVDLSGVRSRDVPRAQVHHRTFTLKPICCIHGSGRKPRPIFFV